MRWMASCWRFLWKWLLSAQLLLGCTSSMNVEIVRKEGLFNSTAKYKIPFTSPNKSQFISDEWIIDNYIIGKWKEKYGSEYQGLVRVDRSDNGRTTTENVHYYDLKLVNKTNNGVIWISSHEVLYKQANLDLNVLLNEYVDSLSGSNFHVVSNFLNVDGVRETSFAATLQEKKETTVGPYKALEGTISIANLHQLKLNPQHRHSSVRILLFKIPCSDITRTIRKKKWVAPILVIVGVHNKPEYFDQNVKDYDLFVRSIVFDNASAS